MLSLSLPDPLLKRELSLVVISSRLKVAEWETLAQDRKRF